MGHDGRKTDLWSISGVISSDSKAGYGTPEIGRLGR